MFLTWSIASASAEALATVANDSAVGLSATGGVATARASQARRSLRFPVKSADAFLFKKKIN